MGGDPHALIASGLPARLTESGTTFGTSRSCLLLRHFPPVRAVAYTASDPVYDGEGRARAAAVRISRARSPTRRQLESLAYLRP